MAEPLSGSVAVVSAIAKLVAELAKLGYQAWKSNDMAMEHLVGILTYVQDELERNYKSLQDAVNGSTDEWLELVAYESGIQALGPAFKDDPSVLDPLRSAYQSMTGGFQTHLADPGEHLDEITGVWCLVGQASWEIDKWFVQYVAATKLSKQECTYRNLHELTGGWPRAEQLRVLKKWKEFVEARQRSDVGEFTLNELALPTMYVDPQQELRLRERAQAMWEWRYSFELIEGIFELWLEPSIRLLYSRTAYDPVLLDIVRLSGRREEGWTPKWYADRARCRAENRAKQYS